MNNWLRQNAGVQKFWVGLKGFRHSQAGLDQAQTFLCTLP